MLKILNDKSIKYRRFSSIMRVFLDKKFLFVIMLFVSCNQASENKTEEIKDSREFIEAIYEVPISLKKIIYPNIT